MHSDPEFEPPVNPLPPVIVVLALIMVLVEGALSLAGAGIIGGPTGIGWRIGALQDYGMSPLVFEVIVTRGDYSFDLIRRFVTYAFVHGDFTHALFCIALLLALGKFVGDAFGSVKTLVVFLGGAICGAIIFSLIARDSSPLFGAYPPIFALIGAYTYILWLRLGQTGQNQIAAFRLIGFLLALQLVFGLLFGSGQSWIAELAGFVFGFGAATILVPGGWGALLARLRQRG
jgi:membrane associated rhomboid family serine protease